MFFEEPRTDGLLRGPRNERKELMSALGDAPWDMETFLAFHLGLLDHSEDVRVAAMEALQCTAQRKPGPLALTPVALLAHFMHAFTVASGIGLATFRCLVELDTAESLEVVKAVLESARGNNNQFEHTPVHRSHRVSPLEDRPCRGARALGSGHRRCDRSRGNGWPRSRTRRGASRR